MPSDNNNFIVGVCTRTQGALSFVEARAQSIEGVISDVSSSSHKLFGNNGEFEVRSARSAIKAGDWVIARPALEGPPKRQRYVAPTGKRLLAFEDLSSLYAPEAARRLLVETGRQDGFAGDKVFRISLSDIIEVRMAVSPDGRSRISQPEDLTTLPVWSYLAGRHIRLPTQAGVVDLFVRDSGASQSSFVNWCSDVEFVRQVIQSFARENVDDDVLKRAAEFLSAHVEALEGKLSKTELLDPRIGQEIMRSRKLAELMTSQDDMLRDFMGVLRNDPDVQAQLTERTEQLAKEAADARSEALVRERTVALEAELQERSSSGRVEIEHTLRDLETSMLAEMEARVKSAEQGALAEISARKTALQAEVDLLTERYAEIAAQQVAEAARLGEAQARLLELDKEVANRKDEIDRFIRMELLVQERKSAPY